MIAFSTRSNCPIHKTPVMPHCDSQQLGNAFVGAHSTFRVSMRCRTLLTDYKTYIGLVLTTPSTPIHDAHQEGYSFIELASRLIRSQRGAPRE